MYNNPLTPSGAKQSSGQLTLEGLHARLERLEQCMQPLFGSEPPATVLALCRKNLDTAVVLVLWARANPAMRRRIAEKPFLRQHVMPSLAYDTSLDALCKAVVRQM